MNPRRAFVACVMAGPWIAAWVAFGTVRLNQESPWAGLDRLVLFLTLALVYGLLMLLFGLLVLALGALVERLVPSPRGMALAAHGRCAAAAAPWLICLLLAELSPSGDLLRDLLPPSWSPWAGFGLAVLGAGLLSWRWGTRSTSEVGEPDGGAGRRPWRYLPRRPPWLAVAATALPLVLLFWPQAPPVAQDTLRVPLPPSTSTPPPLVLLVIDGADLDDMILPLVEAGELPTFAALMQQGTWGTLRSRQPTLSPALWTTLATGKEAEQHGIRDFVYYHLPGVRPHIHLFPRASGLNYQIFPLLESLPLGFERPPYSRLQRRARPLWDIVAERHRVGVYRWLVTWPAKPVNGFVVAGGVYAGPGNWNPKAKVWLQRMRNLPGAPLEDLALYPADAMDGLEATAMGRPADDALQAYAPTVPLDRRNRFFRLVTRSLIDPTDDELPRLIAKYGPQLVVANFFPVDALQHRFGTAYREDRPWGGAIAQAYRHTDRQLGRFLATLPPEHHLLVVSDHGYDFDLDHHLQAPDGIFFGRGPAFEAGRRVDGLDLIDIAPMVLRLLDFPLADDLPGASNGRYRRALSTSWMASTAGTETPQLPTYERPATDTETLPSGSLSEEMKDELRSLGYIQ